MTTITNDLAAPMLGRLFAQDDATDPALTPSVADCWNGLTGEDKARLVRSRTNYADFYACVKDVPLAVSREMGDLFYILARSSCATAIVEFGTSFGLSTICLASALRDNGGGLLNTSELEPSKIAHAKANLADAGLADLFEFRECDAPETLVRNLLDGVDLLLLDGAKSLYRDILDLVAPHLRARALIVADNADFCPAYLDRAGTKGCGYLSVGFANEIEVMI